MNSVKSRLASIKWGRVALFLFGTCLMVQNHLRYLRFLRTFGFWPPSKAARTFMPGLSPDPWSESVGPETSEHESAGGITDESDR